MVCKYFFSENVHCYPRDAVIKTETIVNIPNQITKGTPNIIQNYQQFEFKYFGKLNIINFSGISSAKNVFQIREISFF